MSTAKTSTITGASNIPQAAPDRRLALLDSLTAATLNIDRAAADLGERPLWDTASISVERAQVETRTLLGSIRTVPGRHTVTVTVTTLLPDNDRDTALAEAQAGDTVITFEAHAE